MSTTAQQGFDIPGDLMFDVRKGAMLAVYRFADGMDHSVWDYVNDKNDGAEYRAQLRKMRVVAELLDAIGDDLKDTTSATLDSVASEGLRVAVTESIDERRYELSEMDSDRPIEELRGLLDRIDGLERLLATVDGASS